MQGTSTYIDWRWPTFFSFLSPLFSIFLPFPHHRVSLGIDSNQTHSKPMCKNPTYSSSFFSSDGIIVAKGTLPYRPPHSSMTQQCGILLGNPEAKTKTSCTTRVLVSMFFFSWFSLLFFPLRYSCLAEGDVFLVVFSVSFLSRPCQPFITLNLFTFSLLLSLSSSSSSPSPLLLLLPLFLFPPPPIPCTECNVCIKQNVQNDI